MIVGIGRIAISVVCLPLHFIIIYIFISKKQYRNNMAFVIMTWFGVVDSINLMAHLTAGVMIILQSHVGVQLERVVGAILMSSWVGIPTMAFLLALHRLTAITIGTPTATHETAFYYMLLVSAWILYVSIMVLHLFDDAAIYFNTDYLSFDYVPTSFNSTMALYESYMILLMLSLSLACYIGIFLYLLGYKKFMKVERPEVILLVQAFVIFSYIASLRCVWQFGEPLYMDRPSVVRFLDICNCLMGGINPIVYLGFSKGLRKQFIAVFRRRGVRVTESTLQTESPSNSYIQFESCSVSYI